MDFLTQKCCYRTAEPDMNLPTATKITTVQFPSEYDWNCIRLELYDKRTEIHLRVSKSIYLF